MTRLLWESAAGGYDRNTSDDFRQRFMANQEYAVAIPHVIELANPLTPPEAFRRLAHRPGCLFLDSARRNTARGRYSFITADPFETRTICDDAVNPVGLLAESLCKYRTATVPGLPPFQGGIAGLWSYDLARTLERIPPNRFDEFKLPYMHVGSYDIVLAFDHELDKAWIISQGLPEIDPARREIRARERAKQFQSWLRSAPNEREWSRPKIFREQLAPAFDTHYDSISSNFTREDYERTIRRIIEYIHAGDVFQVNLSQRLLTPANTDAALLYLELRRRNPAPFAGYFDLGDHQIISASPERFLQVQDRMVEARPIKGTRPRMDRPEAELYSGAALRASEKDLAENVMIVDLMRNDLSRVCIENSVKVTQLCQLETYEFVHHLVSVVQSRLQEGTSPAELIRAAFPGGSITGAPKVRAMEIIAELEPTARGAYCGSLGYFGFDGSVDLNILIRTITASHGWWQFPVGGGIVAQSDPKQEHAETWHKAEGILQPILKFRS